MKSRYLRQAWYESEIDRDLYAERYQISEFTVIEEIKGLPYYHFDRSTRRYYEGPVLYPDENWKPMEGE